MISIQMGGAEDVAEVTVHVSAKPEKKKKSKRSSKKSGGASSGNGGGASAEAGFGNPLYGAQDDEPEVGLLIIGYSAHSSNRLELFRPTV